MGIHTYTYTGYVRDRPVRGTAGYVPHVSMSQNKYDIKVVLLGKAAVGKTCLVERFVHGRFSDATSTAVGAAFGAKRVEYKGQTITMGVWDTAGSERYESMTKIYYRNAFAAIVCYDLTNKDSYARMQFWADEIMQSEPKCRIYICGCKKDLIDA